MTKILDVAFVRQHFPAFREETRVDGCFFDSAAGSFPCDETISALNEFYRFNKVQPGHDFEPSQSGWQKMMASKSRWSNALGVEPHNLGFGPSTTQNIYVLCQAFAEVLKDGDEVIVTNQDHESNTGIIRRVVERCGATLKEWRVDSDTGLLALDDYQALLSKKTKLVCVPRSSNVAGQKNPLEDIIAMAHELGAFVLVDAVSYAPHHLEDVQALGADIYVFSLYKVFSVHLGILVMSDRVMEYLPRQGHYFKAAMDVTERFVPAGQDHAQVAAAGAVLEYVETLAAHHGGLGSDLRQSCVFVSNLWQQHELTLTAPLLSLINSCNDLRLIGSDVPDEKRCPLIAFTPKDESASDWVHMLSDQGMFVTSGHYFAPRLLEAVGITPSEGVIRISLAHYNTPDEITQLCQKIKALSGS